MLELLLIILLVVFLFGGARWRASGAIVGDTLGVILLVLVILIVLSLLTPWPYRHSLFW
jgi:hypothetical protein